VRRLPLALLPLLLLLLLLLLPLLLPLLLSLEGDKKCVIHVWTANDGTWPFTGEFHFDTEDRRVFFTKIASPVC
jgi:hypothetical protein